MFFGKEQIMSALVKCISYLENANYRSKDYRALLLVILRAMRDDPKAFDGFCELSIKNIGGSFERELLSMSPEMAGSDPDSWRSMYISAYRFLVEFNLNFAGDLPFHLNAVLQNGGLYLEGFDQAQQNEIRWAQTQLPMQVVRSLINDPRISELRDAKGLMEGIAAATIQAHTDLQGREKRVAVLAKKLDELKTGYNFVGLHKGFDTLHSRKKTEWVATLAMVVVFAVLLVVPLGYELFQVRSILAEKGEIGLRPLVYFIPPMIALELILLYFLESVSRDCAQWMCSSCSFNCE